MTKDLSKANSVAVIGTNPKTVAEVIKATRIAQGMNSRDFGAALGISHAAVIQFENGQTAPSGETLAKWFNSETDWVYEMTKEIFVARYRENLDALNTAHRLAAEVVIA